MGSMNFRKDTAVHGMGHSYCTKMAHTSVVPKEKKNGGICSNKDSKPRTAKEQKVATLHLDLWLHRLSKAKWPQQCVDMLIQKWAPTML